MSAPVENQITLWLPERGLVTHQALGKLAEELGEAAQIAARCIIQGLDASDPKTGTPNREALAKELADIHAASFFLAEVAGLRIDAGRVASKQAGFHQWADMLLEHLEASNV